MDLMSQRLALVIRRVANLARALESLANMLPGVEVKFTGFTDSLVKGFDAAAKKASKNFNEEFLKPPPSAAIKKWTDDLTKKMRESTPTFTPIVEGMVSSLIAGIDKAGKFAALLAPKAPGAGLTPAASRAAGGRNSAGRALLRGSAEAFSATRFSKRGDDPIKKVEKNTKKSLAEDLKGNALLTQIAGFLKPAANAARDLIPGAGG